MIIIYQYGTVVTILWHKVRLRSFVVRCSVKGHWREKNIWRQWSCSSLCVVGILGVNLSCVYGFCPIWLTCCNFCIVLSGFDQRMPDIGGMNWVRAIIPLGLSLSVISVIGNIVTSRSSLNDMVFNQDDFDQTVC